MGRAAMGHDVDSLDGGADCTCLLRQRGDCRRLYERRLSASQSVEGAAGVQDRLAVHCPCDSELRSLDIHIHQGLPHLATIPGELSHQDTLQNSSPLEKEDNRERLVLRSWRVLVPHSQNMSFGCLI